MPMDFSICFWIGSESSRPAWSVKIGTKPGAGAKYLGDIMNFKRKRLGAALLLAAMAVAQPAHAGTIVKAWWSQIMGMASDPAPTAMPAPLNLHARVLIQSDALTPQNPAAICALYHLIDSTGTKIAPSWTARHNPLSFPDLLVCDHPLAVTITRATLVETATQAAVTASMRGPNGTPVAQQVDFPGAAPVGQGGTALRMAVFGDSGCRGGGRQPCRGSAANAWVFPKLIDDAVKARADLVLHLGDYRYRGQHHDSDTWDLAHWMDDFFTAAQPSLAATPWAFSRGNHETCTNEYAGRGFYLFFGHRNTACNKHPRSDGKPPTKWDVTATIMEPWFFDLALRGGTAPHRVIMVDNASNRVPAKVTAAYAKALTWAQTGWKTGAASAWIASHRPIWGLDTQFEAQNDMSELSDLAAAVHAAPKSVLAGCAPYRAKTCGLKAILGGHQHNLQNIVFPADAKDSARLLPQQIVVGHSGVELREQSKPVFTKPFVDAALSSCMTGESGWTGAHITGQVVDWVSRSGPPGARSYHYGYVLFSRDGSQKGEQSGWAGQARFASGIHRPLAGQLGSAGLATPC